MSLSVTRTTSVKHRSAKGFRPQRAYDYLYDPVHTVSGEADHARSSFKAYASADRLRRVQDFDSMFSSNPRFALQLSAVDPVPPSIDRRWPGAMERHRHTVQALDGVAPGSRSWLRETDCDVNAADRWKFSTRPLIAFDRPPPPDLLLAQLLVQQQAPTGPYHRTVGVQTDYRDSEAQTDPYSPEYVVRPGTAHPELLLLASLTWGGGLPAGLAEVEMIERARARRLWEAGLPPLEDLGQLERRRAMMEAMETREWAFREGEIRRLQEARLAALRDLLHQRAQEQTQATAQRQDLNLTRHQSHKESKLRQIHGDYILSLRKLTAKRANVEGRLERRDVVRDHTDHASQAYAPLTRGGSVPDRVHSRSVGGVSSRFLDTYQGLLELEASLPASVLEPRIQAPGPRASRGFVGRAERREMELTQTHEALRAEKDRVEVVKPLRFLVKKERPAPRRPPTPSVDPPPEGEEEREVAAIVLQKLLRGRSIQYQMFAGKEKNLALIREVRTTHALLGEEQRLLRTQTALVLGQQSQRDQQSQQEAEAAASRDGLVGAELVELLDSLAKELIRLQEERRIHAVALLAERERRLREAEESGRRQVEERRRREQDEIFRQVVQVQQATVELYLEDIILGVVESTAGQQARDEVQRMAREVNDVAYALEESHSEQQAEELVSALVFSFLIPEVQRISVRQKVRDRQRRHLAAAQVVINGATGGPRHPAPVQTPGPRSEGPQVQTPRPGSGGPQVQTPRPGSGGPQVQTPRPGSGGPQVQTPRPGTGGPPGPGSGGPQVQTPGPSSEGPQVQTPRPGSGGPQVQTPRPGSGGPQVQTPRPGSGGPQVQTPRPGTGGPPGPGSGGPPGGPRDPTDDAVL
ncbi:unnamed protein product [Arctogadus glacialis]